MHPDLSWGELRQMSLEDKDPPVAAASTRKDSSDFMSYLNTSPLASFVSAPDSFPPSDIGLGATSCPTETQPFTSTTPGSQPMNTGWTSQVAQSERRVDQMPLPRPLSNLRRIQTSPCLLTSLVSPNAHRQARDFNWAHAQAHHHHQEHQGLPPSENSLGPCRQEFPVPGKSSKRSRQDAFVEAPNELKFVLRNPDAFNGSMYHPDHDVETHHPRLRRIQSSPALLSLCPSFTAGRRSVSPKRTSQTKLHSRRVSQLSQTSHRSPHSDSRALPNTPHLPPGHNPLSSLSNTPLPPLLPALDSGRDVDMLVPQLVSNLNTNSPVLLTSSLSSPWARQAHAQALVQPQPLHQRPPPQQPPQPQTHIQTQRQARPQTRPQSQTQAQIRIQEAAHAQAQTQTQKFPNYPGFPSPPISPGIRGGGSGLCEAGSPGGSDDEERGKGKGKNKAQTRLARKAEAARASRRRKKAYVASLEEKVSRLTARLAELQAAGGGQQRTSGDALREEQRKTKAKMQSMLEATEDPQNDAALARLMTTFVAESRQRQNSFGGFLDKLEEALVPDVHAKFALWGLNQTDDFYRRDKPALWNAVMSQEVGLSADQLSQLFLLRLPVRSVMCSLNDTGARVKAVRETIGLHLEQRSRHFDDIARIFTPRQLAKLFLWADRNSLYVKAADPT